MNSDIKLDGGFVIMEGNWTKLRTLDLMLDAPSRRKNNDGQRRALVHNSDDGLTIGYNNDYPGGISFGGRIRGKTFMDDLDVKNIRTDNIHIGSYRIKIDKDKLAILEDMSGKVEKTIELVDVDLPRRMKGNIDKELQILQKENKKLQEQLSKLANRMEVLERR